MNFCRPSISPSAAAPAKAASVNPPSSILHPRVLFLVFGLLLSFSSLALAGNIATNRYVEDNNSWWDATEVALFPDYQWALRAESPSIDGRNIAAPDAITAATTKFWNTNGTSGTWTATNWGTTAAGPFTSGWVSMDVAGFTANSLITYVTTTNVGGINVTNASTVTLTAAGSFTTTGTVVTFDVGTGSILDFAAQGISTAAGTGIIKSGNGIFFSANPNAYTGGFTLNAGTIILGGVNAMGAGGALTINGGTLAANASRTFTGKFTSFTIGGDFTMGAVTAGVGSGNGSSAANISIDTNAGLGASTRTITIGSDATYSLLGILSSATPGTGLIVAASGGAVGNLTLSGASTFAGGTTVNSGILAVGAGSTVTGGVVASGPIGKGTLTLNGGTFRSTAATAGGDRTFQNNLALSGTVTMGSATNTGVLTFNSTGLTTPATITLLANTALTNPSTLTLNNAISGGFNLSKAGAGTLNLGALNTFSGTFTASGGITNLNVNGALGSVTSLIIGTGATVQTPGTGTTDAINDAASITMAGTANLDLRGGTETLASLASTSGAPTVKIGDFGAVAGSFTVGDGSSTTFAGVISGSRATAGPIFTKQGGGTLTLSGANTYTGTTLISNGTLEVANNGSTTAGRIGSTATITVNSGGTLLLSGSGSADRINNSAGITLNGGTLAKGSGVNEGSTSAVGMGALTLTANSTLDFTQSSGTLTFASFSPSTFTLAITNYIGTGSPGGTDQLIFNQDQATRLGSFDFGFGAGVNVAESDLGGGFWEVYSTTPIPEPSTWIGGALALGAIGITQRKRFAKRFRVLG